MWIICPPPVFIPIFLYSAKSEPPFSQLYQCAINMNTGLNLILEFTLKGLIFDNFPAAKELNPLAYFLPVWWQAKGAAGTSRSGPPTHKFTE